MKKLIINGYPGKKGLIQFLSEEYFKVQKEKGHEVKKINLYDLKFDFILHEGYKKHQELEKDLVEAQKKVEWAEEIIFFYPIWWGEMPSLLRSFIERIFVSGFAFKYHSSKRIKLLKGKKAKIISTAGGPRWYYNTLGFIDQKRTLGRILYFCGIKSTKIISFGGVRKSMSEKYKNKIIKNILKS